MKDTPILLLQGNYYGTLTAARSFGEYGCSVHVADAGFSGAALYSRWVQKTWRCPPLSQESPFLNWLIEYGQRRPGTFLYPSSDDACFLIAKNREALQSHFLLLSPALDTLMTLLDKARLHRTLQDLQQPVLPTAFPNNAQEATVLQTDYPCLLKPRTQVLQKSGIKGEIVTAGHELSQAFATFQSTMRLAPSILSYDGTLGIPMVQQYIAAAPDSIVSVAGFFDAESGVQACFARKVLQRPRRLGIGLCFEAIEPIASLQELVATLCRHIGYEGIFEAEFVQTSSSAPFWLMDFNPRFYSQMAMEVSRHLNLPLLALDLAQQRAGLATQRRKGPKPALPPLNKVKDRYAHSLILLVFIFGQGATGRMKGGEILRWLGWLIHRQRLTDAVWSFTDPLPGVVDAVQFVAHALRYPRGFIRKFFGVS